MTEKPIHIAFYSFGGHTRDAATRLAGTLGSDATSEEIQPVSPPRGLPGYWRMAWGALTGKAWSIEPPAERRAGCKVLVIATPMWAGRLPPPSRAYLSSVERTCPVAVLVTHGGSQPTHLLRQVADLIGKPVAVSVAISDEDRKHHRADAKVDDFAEALRRLA